MCFQTNCNHMPFNIIKSIAQYVLAAYKNSNFCSEKRNNIINVETFLYPMFHSIWLLIHFELFGAGPIYLLR